LVTNLAYILKRYVQPVSRWSSIVGNVSLLAMVLVVVVAVASRFALALPIAGNIELVKILLVLVIFSGMAYTALNKRHIRVDVITSRFSEKARLAFTVSGDLLALVSILIVSWQIVLNAHNLWLQDWFTAMLKIPLWPFALASAVFMGLFALAILVNFLESLGKLQAYGIKNYLWLVPGIMVTLALFGMSFWPSLFLPIKIEPQIFGIIALLLMLTLVLLHVHIGVAMIVTALLGMSYLSSPQSGLASLALTSFSVASDYVWSVAPLFMLMGILVSVSGFGRDLYEAAYKWLGHLPGGLASATIAACAAMAAVIGESLSAIATFGTVALPQMRAHGYDVKLATGAIASGSTIGILIPPSIGFVIYGIMIEESIGKLFMAGVFPGILMATMLIGLVYVRCRINPTLGPRGDKTTVKEKIVSLRYTWPVLVLFVTVIGGIFLGIFTPIEGGGIGAFGVIVLGLSLRRFTFRSFSGAVSDSCLMASFVFFLIIFAVAFTQFFAITKLPFAMAEFFAGLAVPGLLIIVLILLMYLVLGCVLNAIPVLILTLPIIFPTVVALGFDPIWFGVLMVIMIEVGTLTPPIGIVIFVLNGIAPDIPMYTMFRGVVPFWIVMLGVVAILLFFPQIALFLPNLLIGS